MSLRTIISAAAVVLAMLLVPLAPTGAAAHGIHAGHSHAMPVKHGGASSMTDKSRLPADAISEVRTHVPVSADHPVDTDCGDRGCCSNGHCSGCSTAMTPGAWTCFRLAANILLLNPNASPPVGLAREGPPRPPKSLA